MLGFCVAIVAVATFVLAGLFGGSLVPRSVPVLAAFLRSCWPSCAATSPGSSKIATCARPTTSPSRSSSSAPAMRGNQITRTLLRSPNSPYRPVALVDDDPRLARMQLNGLRVRGTGADALDVATRHGAGSVLVAIPSITGEQLRVFAAPLLEAGLQVLVLPPVAELLGQVRPSDIRPITVADLLGRHPAEVDTAAIAGYVTGRRVLVTGAGGSIGAELCRQLHSFHPSALVMLDRDESGLHATQLELEGRALLDSPSLVLADIRDRERIFQVFQQHRPEVVFHAAALKHLPLLEFNPSEAWKTNVVGTHHVLEAAEAAGVARLVNVSSDKAADPASVLGFVKRICERLTAEVADRTGLPYVSVRFGNVLGSKGSMLGVFERQIRDGGPITVTHPDVSRYFMTSAEAIALTIQAGAIGRPGRGARARHGRAGADRRGRHPPGRASLVDGADRLHRAAARREAARGAPRRRRGGRAAHPSADQPGAGAPAALRRRPDGVLGRRPAGAVGRLAGDRRRVGVGRAADSAVVHHDGGR